MDMMKLKLGRSIRVIKDLRKVAEKLITDGIILGSTRELLKTSNKDLVLGFYPPQEPYPLSIMKLEVGRIAYLKFVYGVMPGIERLLGSLPHILPREVKKVRTKVPSESPLCDLLEKMGFILCDSELLMGRDLSSYKPKNKYPPFIKIRTFKPGDEINWVQVRNEAFKNEPMAGRPWTIEDFKKRFLKRLEFNPEEFFFAEYRGRIVGIAHGRKYSEGVGQIYCVAVLPSYRRRGIGRALTETVLAYLKAKGCKKVILVTYSSLRAAVRLYLSLGFKILRELKIYELQLHGDDSLQICSEKF